MHGRAAFSSRTPKGPAANPVESRLDYRRLATAAEAIRFVVRDFPALRTLGAWMQVRSGWLFEAAQALEPFLDPFMRSPRPDLLPVVRQHAPLRH
jgi:hypothetical protein